MTGGFIDKWSVMWIAFSCNNITMWFSTVLTSSSDMTQRIECMLLFGILPLSLSFPLSLPLSLSLSLSLSSKIYTAIFHNSRSQRVSSSFFNMDYIKNKYPLHNHRRRNLIHMYNACKIQFAKHTPLAHWGRVTHICINKLTISGSANGLSPGRDQAIIWTSAEILLFEPHEPISVISYAKFIHFHSSKCISKCLRNGGYFVLARMC